MTTIPLDGEPLPGTLYTDAQLRAAVAFALRSRDAALNDAITLALQVKALEAELAAARAELAALRTDHQSPITDHGV